MLLPRPSLSDIPLDRPSDREEISAFFPPHGMDAPARG